MSERIIIADVLDGLRTLPDESVQCVVTSPPYFGLRDYGIHGQLGLEKTPDAYITNMVAVFAEVRRVLRKDGTCWLNMGDSYANDGKWGGHTGGKHAKALHASPIGRNKRYTGLAPKDLIGVPWMLAFALRADGWRLRQDIIWQKPNPMPESVRDRCTKAHEYLFLLAKSGRYYYDADAIKEPASPDSHARYARVPSGWDIGGGDHRELRGRYAPGVNPKAAANAPGSKQNASFSAAVKDIVDRRNKRSVWTIPTQPFPGAHFATFPEALVEPCILAGSRRGDTVLDPFAGSGTLGVVAARYGRDFIGIELNPEYAALAERRMSGTQRSLIA